MGSKPDWRSIEMEMRSADRVATEVERRQCTEVVEAWNERTRIRRSPDPSPSIRVALVAGYRWLGAYCPGCRQERDIDLAAVDCHHGAAISSLIPRLSCRACPGGAPFAKFTGLSREPRSAVASTRRRGP